jgi:methylated-DNA-protein-cysteine methyltransferase-like protein
VASQSNRDSAWDAVYQVTRRIPRGRVATYGQIAQLLDGRLSARAVGWALHVCPNDVPWQRVVNASGRCSTDRLGHVPAGLQLAILKAEGVSVREDGSVDLGTCRWRPKGRESA